MFDPNEFFGLALSTMANIELRRQGKPWGEIHIWEGYTDSSAIFWARTRPTGGGYIFAEALPEGADLGHAIGLAIQHAEEHGLIWEMSPGHIRLAKALPVHNNPAYIPRIHALEIIRRAWAAVSSPSGVPAESGQQTVRDGLSRAYLDLAKGVCQLDKRVSVTGATVETQINNRMDFRTVFNDGGAEKLGHSVWATADFSGLAIKVLGSPRRGSVEAIGPAVRAHMLELVRRPTTEDLLARIYTGAEEPVTEPA